MKKTIIGALVGGLILFIWQFLSWTTLNIHGSNMAYTPQQDQILEALQTSGIDEGSYFVPNLPPGSSTEDYETYTASNTGKPWATISYHKSLQDNMTMNMIRGFVVDFLVVFLLCYLLMGNPVNNFKLTLTSTMIVGLIGYLSISYLDAIWFQNNSIPNLIDTVVSFGLVGAWLGWYLPAPSAD